MYRLNIILILGQADSYIFAKVENITDELAYSSTSFIKDLAPLPGRNFQLGMRVYF